MLMKKYIIVASLSLLPCAFVHGPDSFIKISDDIYLQGFGVESYITTYRRVLLDTVLGTFVTEHYSAVRAEDMFWFLVQPQMIRTNVFARAENFLLADYIWLVKRPDTWHILRSRKAGDINLIAHPPRLPNFDIKHPNFVVIDPVRPVIDTPMMGYMRISLPHFVWNIDEGPKTLPQTLTSIFAEARTALYLTDSLPLSELVNNLLVLGM